MSIKKILSLAGKRVEIASNLKIDTSAITQWIRRSSIPSEHWPTLIKMSQGKLTADILMRACVKR